MIGQPDGMKVMLHTVIHCCWRTGKVALYAERLSDRETAMYKATVWWCGSNIQSYCVVVMSVISVQNC